MTHAIVLDGNQRSALATVRSLGKHGVSVLVAETKPGSLAAGSRFCTATAIHPDPGTAPDEFKQWLLDLSQQYPESVLLPMTDVTVPLVLNTGAYSNTFKTALPSVEAYETASDKYRLFDLARHVGVRVPATAIVSRASLDTLKNIDFRYPVVVKPRRSTVRLVNEVIKRGVCYAENAAALTRIAREQLLDDADELLIQEFIAGAGAGVFALYENGKPLFFFAHQRIREKPPSGGVSVVCESCPLVEERVAAARRLLDPLQWHGIAMVEFKIDAANQAWLIEINARFWGSLQLAVDSKADFPWYVYQLAQGQQPAVPAGYDIGRRLRWWLGDLDNLYARLRDPQWTPTWASKARALAEFSIPWQPKTRSEFLRWNDPAPAWTELKQYASALVGSRRASNA